MANLLFDINTLPTVTAYVTGTESLNPSIFVAIAAEGKEEVLYLTEIENIIKSHSRNIKLIILNNYYANTKAAVAKSHPNQRYKLLEEWRELYKAKYGISSNDEEWLICDRDNQSFKVNQYNNYIALSNANNHFHFIVSNPAFQLWLLLHFTSDIPTGNIESEPTCKKRIRYVEKLLKKYVKAYKHGSLDWTQYEIHVRDAIKNSQQYAGLSLDDLRDKTGSHFYQFLEFLENELGKQIF